MSLIIFKYVNAIYIKKMFSLKFNGHSGNGTQDRKSSMSYTFGPHTLRKHDYIYYEGDGRIVKQDPLKIPIEDTDLPAWAIATLMFNKKMGYFLTDYEEEICSRQYNSEGLQWLQDYLS